MGTQEQYGGFAVAVLAFDAGKGVEALAGKAFGQQREEIRDGRPTGELVIRGVQEAIDGFDAPKVLAYSRSTRVAAVLSASF